VRNNCNDLTKGKIGQIFGSRTEIDHLSYLGQTDDEGLKTFFMDKEDAELFSFLEPDS
jgi:hypothetical protein